MIKKFIYSCQLKMKKNLYHHALSLTCACLAFTGIATGVEPEQRVSLQVKEKCNPLNLKPSIELLYLSAKEAKSHPDQFVRECALNEPGFSKNYLFLNDFPNDTLLSILIKRPLLEQKSKITSCIPKPSSKEKIQFMFNDNLPKEHKFICLPSKGFLLGERVTLIFTDDNGFEIEASIIPNPIKVTSQNETVTIEAELLGTYPANYIFSFKGFQADEVIDVTAISGNEKIKCKFCIGMGFMLMPGVIGEKGGVAKSSFKRKSGEEIQVDLPWGMEFLRTIQFSSHL